MPDGAFVVTFSLITGQPTVTKRPPVGQNRRKNVQKGGGAYIPYHWLVQCPYDAVGEVKATIKRAISELGDEGADMDVEV